MTVTKFDKLESVSQRFASGKLSLEKAQELSDEPVTNAVEALIETFLQFVDGGMTVDDNNGFQRHHVGDKKPSGNHHCRTEIYSRRRSEER